MFNETIQLQLNLIKDEVQNVKNGSVDSSRAEALIAQCQSLIKLSSEEMEGSKLTLLQFAKELANVSTEFRQIKRNNL